MNWTRPGYRSGMVSIGYALLGEQTGPHDLLAYAARGEEAGFDFEATSNSGCHCCIVPAKLWNSMRDPANRSSSSVSLFPNTVSAGPTNTARTVRFDASLRYRECPEGMAML